MLASTKRLSWQKCHSALRIDESRKRREYDKSSFLNALRLIGLREIQFEVQSRGDPVLKIEGFLRSREGVNVIIARFFLVDCHVTHRT